MTDIQVLYDGPIVKRAEAVDQGLEFYFTGKPCKHGHLDQRQVNNRTCRQCLVQTNIRNSKSKAQWAIDNRDAVLKSKREYYLRNKENILHKHKMRRLENPDKKREENRIWWSTNKDKARVYNSNRRAMVRGADGSYCESDIHEILEIQSNKCAEPTCRKDLSNGYHVDHIMPLALGGSNWPSNLQCLCPSCNSKKGAKHPLDWAKENGRLF